MSAISDERLAAAEERANAALEYEIDILARDFVEYAPRDVIDLVAEVRRLRALAKSGAEG